MPEHIGIAQLRTAPRQHDSRTDNALPNGLYRVTGLGLLSVLPIGVQDAVEAQVDSNPTQ